MSEADIHFELYWHLQNAIAENPARGGITYGTVRPEYGEGIDGRADVVVFDTDDDPVFVVEAKRPDDGGGRDIDPYAPAVIRQGFRYAGDVGAPLFCTYNGDRLVIFDAFTEGVALLERSTKSYTISDTAAFADTLLSEVARLRAGEARWDALDDAFIDRIHSLHEYVSPRLQASVTEHLAADDAFRDAYATWTAAQGVEYEEMDDSDQRAARREFAEQAAYLLINKILFYKILENAPTYADDVNPLAVSPHRVQADLEDYFEHLVGTVDFEAIYEHDPIYSNVPLDPVEKKVREFIIELDDRDLTQFDSDVIGRIYEGVIPPERRREMGEYYTPPAITDLITRLTVTDASDTVLDPACGSGGFLVSAYHRLRDHLQAPDGSHDRILGQLSGIEINRFPAHLTAINLAIQDLSSYTDEVDVEINDFFDVTRNQRFGRVVAGASGDSWENEDELTEQLGGFDAVVANPPYIRQENIDDTDHVRDHLDNRDVDAAYISRRSDVYVYFLTHGTEFLAEDGHVGFITSDRWLDTQYGEDMQRFVLEQYEIRAIIKFDRQVFDDALVGSSVVVLQRQTDANRREDNVVKFLQVRANLGVQEIADIVEDPVEPDKMVSNESYRLVTQPQRALAAEHKWNLFFMAPPVYFELRRAENVVRVDEVAEVSRGITSGANAFFYRRTEAFRELGIEAYTTSLLKATGQIEQIRFGAECADEWAVLDVHELVQTALDGVADDFGSDDVPRVKRWLSEHGHDDLVEYIEWGEAQGYDDRRSFRNKELWFDLGSVPIAPILNTRFTWREHRMVWNEAGAVADQQFYMIRPDEAVDELVLCGILNSRVSALTSELLGRRAGGEGMTRLQQTIYETEMLSIPDPRTMSDEERAAIRDAVQALMDREAELGEDAPSDAKESAVDDLDRAVLRTMGIADRLDEFKRAVAGLVASRERGAGRETAVLVDRLRETGESEAIELPGVVDSRERTTLDEF
jgi:type I restriction-modification system DNA methylase subunit